MENRQGLSNVVAGECSIETAVQPTTIHGLSLMTCGSIPHNPAELLTTENFQVLLQEVRKDYDFVIIDTPPLLAVTDPSIIACKVDSVLLVLRIRNGIQVSARQAKESLDSVNAKLSGAVVNGLHRKDGMRYSYGGRYGYSSYSASYGRGYRKATVNGQTVSEP